MVIKEYISEAQEGIFLALEILQKYFRLGSDPRETGSQGTVLAREIGIENKFHGHKKNIRNFSQQYFLISPVLTRGDSSTL